jgi:molecular chaperone GrpE
VSLWQNLILRLFTRFTVFGLDIKKLLYKLKIYKKMKKNEELNKKGNDKSENLREDMEKKDIIHEEELNRKNHISEEEKEDPLQKLEKEHDELLDKYLRALANYENLRKRTQQEKENIYNFGIARVFREVLPVVDDFKRAFNSLENNKNENKHDGFIKGVSVIYSKLLNILKNHQIEPFDSTGEKFDPSKHEAVHVVESDKDEGTILEEVEKGYLINNEILRPAKVIVAKPKEITEKKEESKNEKNIKYKEESKDN